MRIDDADSIQRKEEVPGFMADSCKSSEYNNTQKAGTLESF